MLANFLIGALAFAGPTQDAPTEAQVEATLEALEAAYRAKADGPKSNALLRARDVVAPRVIDKVAEGLRFESVEVRTSVLEALRWMDHPDALQALHRIYKSKRDVRRHEQLNGVLLRAIGQHGDPSSVDVLAEDGGEAPGSDATRARILGLGKIRDKRALEALMKRLKRGKPARIRSRMDDYRLSLVVLTGVDRGSKPEAWSSWWNKNKKDFRVAPELPEVPRASLARWQEYWGIERTYGRVGRREDRGGDERR